MPSVWRFRSALLSGAVASVSVLGSCAHENPDRASQAVAITGDVVTPAWCNALPRAAYASLKRVTITSDWFEAWDVGEGVIALYEPKQWQETIAYLVLGSARALLFDTGMGIAPIADVVRQLTDLPVTVLNSHSHMDHVGGNAEFTSVLGMDTDFTRNHAAGTANALVRDEVAPTALCAPLPTGVTEDNYTSRAWSISQVVTDGHTIDLGGRVLQIIAVPGHTPDAVALYDAAAGYLFTGDSFYEGPIWLMAPETDLASYARSVERMAALVPRLTRIFPAHNTPVAEPTRLTELRDVFSAIQAGTLAGTPGDGGTMRYEAGAFSLLLRAR